MTSKSHLIDWDTVEGVPVFAGTQTPTQDLLDTLLSGGTIYDFLESHPEVSLEVAQTFVADMGNSV